MEMCSRVPTTVLPCLILCAVLGLLLGSVSVSVAHFHILLGAASDSVVVFPDQYLEAAVRTRIAKPTGDITTEDMARLTYLETQSLGLYIIRNLTGLEYATNLYHLGLFQHAVSDLSPLAGLTNLQELILHGNTPIADLSPLAGLTRLGYVDLQQDGISNISGLAGLDRLPWLTLSFNQISDLSPLAGLTGLLHLDLNWNLVSDLRPLAGLRNLGSLDLRGNQISDLSPLGGLTNLRGLYLAENQITDISALVANCEAGGIGAGDEVELQDNLLDLSEGSKAMADIQTMINRGASVTYMPQRAEEVEEEASLVTAAMVGFMAVAVAARPGKLTK